jgi:hypothetical protein
VAFLTTLRGQHLAPAVDASRKLSAANQQPESPMKPPAETNP